MNRNQVKGAVKDISGKVERKVGEMTGNRSAQAKGAAKQVEERTLIPFIGGAGGNDLLRQDVERGFGDDELVEIVVLDGTDERRAFHQFVTRGGENAAFRDGPAPVIGTPNALQGDGD